MPGRNGSDGSITIDTGLDTKGFDRGSKELLDAIHSLTQEINQLGKTLQATFSSYGRAAEGSNAEVQQLEATVQTLEAKVQGLNATIAELEAKLAAVGGQQVIDPASLSDAGAAAGSAGQQITALQARIEELEGVAADLRTQLGQIDAQSVSPTLRMEQPRQAVTGLEKDIDKLGASMKGLEGLADAAIGGDMKSLGRFDTQAGKAQDAIDGLKRRLEAFGNTQFETDDYKWVRAEIEKADNALQKLLDRQARMQATGVRENSRAYRSLQYDIEQAQARLNDLLATQQIYEESGNAVIIGADTAQFEQYRAAIEEIENQLAGLQDEVDAAFQPPHVEQWNNMITLSGMIRGAFTSAFASIRNGALLVGQAATHPIQTLDRALGAVASAAIRAAVALLRIAGGAVVSALSKMASAAKKAAVHLAQMAGRGIVSGVKQLASATLRAAKAVFTLGKNAKKSKSGLKSGLMSVLKYGLGIRSVYALVNKLRSAIVGGFENLAQYSNETNQAISSMQSALSQFKNSIAAAFAPIVNVVAPIITRLIELLTSATEKLGQFFAALTGQKTYIRAKAVQENYAASLKNTADKTKKVQEETEKAQKEAAEAERQLAGFDELEILSDNSSKGDSGKNDDDAEKGTSPGDMFETVPVGDGISDFVEQVKAAWAAADFTGIGRIIGDKLKSALDSIPWGPIQSTAGKVGKSIATLLNGVLETPGLFTGLGQTLAEAVNTAFTFLDSFAWNFHWRSLAGALADMVDGACDHLDWTRINSALKGLAVGIANGINALFSRRSTFDKAGATLGKALNAIVISALAFFTVTDFTKVGSTIASGLNSAIRAVNWSQLGQLLAAYVNALVSTVYGAVTTFDWRGTATALAQGLNSAVQNMGWVKAGATLSESVKGLLGGIVTLIEEFDWHQLGAGIAEMVTSIDWNGIAALMFRGLGAALGGLAAFLHGLIEDAWNDAVDWWHDVAFEDGQFTIEGLLDGIVKALKGIGKWIKDHIFTPFIDGFKNAFKINSPSKVMEDQGGYIIDGLKNGIKDAWKNVKTLVKDCAKEICAAFKNKVGDMLNAGKELITNLKNGITSVWSSVKSKVTEYAKEIWQGFKNKANDLKSAGSELMTKLKEGLSNKWSEVKTKVSGYAADIAKGFESKKESLKTAGSNLMSKLNEGLNSRWSGVKTNLSNYANSIKTTFSSIGGSLKTIGGNLMVGLYNGLVEKWNSLVGNIRNIANSITNTMRSAFGEHSPSKIWAQIGRYLMEGLGLGLTGEEKSVLSTVSDIASAVSEEMANGDYAIPKIEANTATAMDGFANTITDSFSDMLDRLQAIADGVTFTAPAVASGAIPYQLMAVGAGGGNASIKGAIEASNDELASVVIQSVTNATVAIVRAIEDNSGTTVNLDKNSITQAVIDEINRKTRMMNENPLLV